MNPLLQPFLIGENTHQGAVLVTGAGGCIGAWVCAILQASNIPVIAADLSEDRRRLHLIAGQQAADQICWEQCDITDTTSLSRIADTHHLSAIIHLAGLQVPFCAENPALGARVNVEGTINILELARHRQIKRTAYASSVAALALPPGGGYKETLYGVYKQANEHSAYVYWTDWQVPSLGIRPNVVYGLGRDQGISARNTFAIQAAVRNERFQIPYSGRYSWLYAGEAAAAFIAAVAQDGEGAPVFDLNGRCAPLEQGVDILKTLNPSADISCSGSAFPFPPDLDETPLHQHLPDYPHISVEQGITDTFNAMQALHHKGLLDSIPS